MEVAKKHTKNVAVAAAQSSNTFVIIKNSSAF